MQTPRVSRAPGGLACLALACLPLIGRTADAAPAATPVEPSPSSALASATAPAPGDRELPLPVVGRWAETLPLHGGPVPDVLRLELPELPWLTAVVRTPGLILHLGFQAEGGCSSIFPDQPWRGCSRLGDPLLRLQPEVRLAGAKALRDGWRLTWALALAVDLQTVFMNLAGDGPMAPVHLLELRPRAAISVARSPRLGVHVSVELLRTKGYEDGHGVLGVDVVDLRLGGEAPLGPWARLRWEYQLAAYLNERLVHLTDHGPLVAATQLLRLEPQARIVPRVWLGFLLEGGRVDLDRALGERFSPALRDGYFVRAMATVEGRPRPWVSYRFGLGYGALLLPGAKDGQESLAWQHASVAHAGLAFRLWKGLHLRLGYWRDFEPLGLVAELLRTNRSTSHLMISSAPNALQYADVVHLGLDALLWQRLSVRATFGWRRSRATPPSWDSRLSTPITVLARYGMTENLFGLLEVDVFVTRWLAVGASYLYQDEEPAGVVPVSPDPNSSLVSFGYHRHRAVGRVTVRY